MELDTSAAVSVIRHEEYNRNSASRFPERNRLVTAFLHQRDGQATGLVFGEGSIQ